MHKAPGSGPASAAAAPWGARPEKPGGDARQGRGWVTGEPACVGVLADRGAWGGAVKAPRARAHRCRPVAASGTADTSNGGWGGRAPRATGGPLPLPHTDRTPQTETRTALQSGRDEQTPECQSSPGGGVKREEQRKKLQTGPPKADGQTDHRRPSHSDKRESNG